MSICKKIKLYLAENDISQTWLSEKAGIAIPKLNASLNDKRKLSVEELGKIVAALGIDANEFLQKTE